MRAFPTRSPPTTSTGAGSGPLQSVWRVRRCADGREPSPPASAWHAITFLNRHRNGAGGRVPHLTGENLGTPPIPAGTPRKGLGFLSRGAALEPYFVEGS